MRSPAAGGASGRRPPAFVAGGGHLEDSDEETPEEAFDDEDEEVDDSGKHLQGHKPWAAAAAEASNQDFSPFASSPTIPNLNGDFRAVHAAGAGREGGSGYATPRRKRRRAGAAGSAEGRKPPAALEDSRRLFQRLWTDEDEIAILRGFLDFSSGRGRAAAAAAAHHHDTGPFYDQIRARLRLDFNRSQLVEKLRRLKKKYRNVTGKMSSGKDYAFRSPHEQATFELSRQIWGNAIYSRGGGEEDDVDDIAPHQVGDREGGGVVTVPEPRRPRTRGRKGHVGESAATPAAGPVVLGSVPVEVKISESHTPPPKAMLPVPSLIQESVRSCLSPMFRELLCCAVGGRTGAGGILEGLTPSLLPLGVGPNQVKLEGAAMADEKWRKQQITELEVFSKRMELVQEQIKLTLRELRSAG